MERFAVEGLHDIFVGARLERRADMRHVVLGGAEHDLRLIAMAALITGMFQSRSTTSGILASQRDKASWPSPASSTSNSSVSSMCLATLRITLESSTIKQLFIAWSFPASMGTLLNDKGNEELKPPSLR